MQGGRAFYRRPSSARRWAAIKTSRCRGARMATPCPRCGATKTESVHHGFVYDTVRLFGYHLRRCSSCNRRRLFKHGRTHRRGREDMTVDELRERFNEVAAASQKPSPVPVTPAGEIAPGSSPNPRVLEGQFTQSSARGLIVQDAEEEYHICPRCGSSDYHRSRRRWYERLTRARRMARCMKCNFRFPYPM
jgi:predicted RNA-binding Zn-ribbon protein involved in translation (DUF1610 family)